MTRLDSMPTLDNSQRRELDILMYRLRASPDDVRQDMIYFIAKVCQTIEEYQSHLEEVLNGAEYAIDEIAKRVKETKRSETKKMLEHLSYEICMREVPDPSEYKNEMS